ncbi:MAG: biotin-dependent carboxyltransferase [Balneola sp.]|nr:MAG: biotin-dependent carboxyltransferase [Balneola sp.]
MGSLKVLSAGLFTTIQDIGRIGFRKYGVPLSGVMDRKAYELSNWLVGNEIGAPVLELTMSGGKYEFETNASIAITGADMKPSINSKPVPINKTLTVERGDTLSFQFSDRGCRAYLAVRGMLEVNQVMNSYSTYTVGGFGGLDGRSLQKGDVLSWEEPSGEVLIREADKAEIPYYSSKVTIKVIAAPEWDWLSEAEQKKVLSQKFTVDSSSNRMGLRLTGNSIEVPNIQMTSSPVMPGIIQLPKSGEPIILMVDGQTIGGYPRILKVLNSELWRLGQVKPGDTVSFERMNIEL